MFENYQTIEDTREENDAFIPIWQSGNKLESMRFLSKQRKVLLQSIHKNQAELECLEGLLTTVRG